MSSLINIFDFPNSEDPSVVYLESDTALHAVTHPDDVRVSKEVFSHILSAALNPDATRSYLEKLAGASSGNR